MMSEFKGTKGPWENVGGWVDSTGKDSKIICAIGSVSMQSEEIQDANANLIAAAPDLLEALQDLYTSSFNSSHWSEQQLDSFSKARAAIAKALGETK